MYTYAIGQSVPQISMSAADIMELFLRMTGSKEVIFAIELQRSMVESARLSIANTHVPKSASEVEPRKASS